MASKALSKYSHNLQDWPLGLQHRDFGRGPNSTYNREGKTDHNWSLYQQNQIHILEYIKYADKSMKSFMKMSNQGINRVLLWPIISIINEDKYIATNIHPLYLYLIVFKIKSHSNSLFYNPKNS